MDIRRLPFSLWRKQSHALYFPARPYFCFNIASTIPRTVLSKRGIADLRAASQPRAFPSLGWDNIDPSLLIEEETIPTYKPERFYPVHIGEVFKHRYQVVGKLGYGSSATVWLCHDFL